MPNLSEHDTAHGSCGKTWKQRGNRTGHCHETFEGETLFDAHRVTLDDGTRGCLDPATMKHAGQTLRLINGSWRGPGMTEEALARRKGAARDELLVDARARLAAYDERKQDE